MSLITLTTDFGTGSPYVAAMKGVIYSLNPAAVVVDVSHEIPAQEVRHAAVVLEDVTDLFPPGSIHVVVVDPGVGTHRGLLFVRIGRQNYLAPDNGVLSRLARRKAPAKIIRLSEQQYWLHPVSATFHGRDILAPVAARLSLDLDPDWLGTPQDSLIMLDWPEVCAKPQAIRGSVLFVDAFGNLITDITAQMLAGRPESQPLRVSCGGRSVDGLSRTYGDRPEGTLVALIGSSGRLELAVVDGSAAGLLKARVSDPVTVETKDEG
jgi:S-adenosyl-L-methionine hydrolase (adenosine-forming)